MPRKKAHIERQAIVSIGRGRPCVGPATRDAYFAALTGVNVKSWKS
jgi:hypothetical protein